METRVNTLGYELKPDNPELFYNGEIHRVVPTIRSKMGRIGSFTEKHFSKG